jgi:hypothetical protein
MKVLLLLSFAACTERGTYSARVGALALTSDGGAPVVALRREDLREVPGAGGESLVAFARTVWQTATLPSDASALDLATLDESSAPPPSVQRSTELPLAGAWLAVEATVADETTLGRSWRVHAIGAGAGAIVPDGCAAAALVDRGDGTAGFALRRVDGGVTLTVLDAAAGVRSEVGLYGLDGAGCALGRIAANVDGDGVIVAASEAGGDGAEGEFRVYRGPADGSGLPEGPFTGHPIAVWADGAEWRALAATRGEAGLGVALVGPEGVIDEVDGAADGCVAGAGDGRVAFVEDGRRPRLVRAVGDGLEEVQLAEIDRVGGSACAVAWADGRATAVWTETGTGESAIRAGTVLTGFVTPDEGEPVALPRWDATRERLD